MTYERIISILLKSESVKLDYFPKKKFETKINLLINFIFARIYILIASSRNLKNDAILTNHESFFWEKDFLQLDRFRFLKINQLLSIYKNFVLENCFFMA